MTSDFTFHSGGYTHIVNLPSEMITFGTYRISYEPPEGALESDVNMSISSEADLKQMLEFFKSFLMATGYPVNPGDNVALQKESDSVFTFGLPTATFWGDTQFNHEDVLGPFQFDNSDGNQ